MESTYDVCYMLSLKIKYNMTWGISKMMLIPSGHEYKVIDRYVQTHIINTILTTFQQNRPIRILGRHNYIVKGFSCRKPTVTDT